MGSVLSQDTGDLADAGRPDIRQNIEKLCLAGGELVTDPPLKRFAVKYKRQGLLLQFAANYFQGGNLLALLAVDAPDHIRDTGLGGRAEDVIDRGGGQAGRLAMMINEQDSDLALNGKLLQGTQSPGDLAFVALVGGQGAAEGVQDHQAVVMIQEKAFEDLQPAAVEQADLLAEIGAEQEIHHLPADRP
jgi:hypothetical protein